MQPRYTFEPGIIPVTGASSRKTLGEKQKAGYDFETLISPPNFSTSLGPSALVIIGQGEEILRLLQRYNTHSFTTGSAANVAFTVHTVNGSAAVAFAYGTVGVIGGGLTGAVLGSKNYSTAAAVGTLPTGVQSRGGLMAHTALHAMGAVLDAAPNHLRNYLVVQFFAQGGVGHGLDAQNPTVTADVLARLISRHL
jgi:hypothetical protein